MHHIKYKNSRSSCPQSLFLSQSSSPDKGRLGGVIAFTLVELIVVVTILAILATIWFVSYSSYLIWVRDTNRIAQMTKMSDGLNLYSTRNALPIPEDYVEVQINGSLIWYQWYAGSSVLETIEYEKGGVDPKDNTYFTYYLTKDRKYFQLLWFLEEWSDLKSYTSSSMRWKPERQGELSLVNRVYANTYSERIPTVVWKKLWVLTDDLNTPIQEIWTISTAWFLDITPSTTWYTAYLTDERYMTDWELVKASPIAHCKRIREASGARSNWFYDINPDGNELIRVYCDMRTDGGGWTALVRINPSIKNSNEWTSNNGSSDGEYYNYMNKSSFLPQNEIYINKTVWYDGWEYLFENKDGNLYAKRGPLKNVMVRENWNGLATNLVNWTGANYDGTWFSHDGTTYTWFLHTNTTTTFYDFPFITQSTDAVSDTPWGWRNYDEDVDAYIFVR